MRVVVAYDVSTTSVEGRRRLRRIAQLCEGYGARVQYSVFECSMDAAKWVELRARLLSEADLSEDRLRFYFLSEDDAAKTEHFGLNMALDFDEPLVF